MPCMSLLRNAFTVTLMTVTCMGSGPVSAASTGECSALADGSFGQAAAVVSAAAINVAGRPRDTSWIPAEYRPTLQSTQPFCRVVVAATPSAQSSIGIEIWLPLSGWNGRFLGTGNGGYPTSVDYRGLLEGVRDGFAVANTDLGLAAHLNELAADSGSSADITSVFVHHPVRMVDFGSRATHEMTWISKNLIARFYGKPARRSYFTGCSTGGMQAFREVQQYPEDYDGVVAGAPGENRARVHLSILWSYMSVWHRPGRVLSDEKLQLIHAAVLASCNGSAREEFLTAPLACKWRPESLLCNNSTAAGECLTPDEVEAVNLIYRGPGNPRTGERYSPGLPRGSELGWSLYMRQADQPLPFRGVFAFALGDDFQFDHFDWDRDARTFIDVVGPYFDALNTDMGAFARRGGKFLLYHGGADPLAPVADTADFYEKVWAAGNEDHARPTGSYFRFFILPGVDHCQGGSGPDHFEQTSTIMKWTENRVAPRSLEVRKSTGGSSAAARKIDAYVPMSAMPRDAVPLEDDRRPQP